MYSIYCDSVKIEHIKNICDAKVMASNISKIMGKPECNVVNEFTGEVERIYQYGHSTYKSTTGEDLQQAYRRVYQDLISQGSVFAGHYDASDPNNHIFMYGVECVMSSIAQQVDDETFDEFDKLFTHNEYMSIRRAEHSD